MRKAKAKESKEKLLHKGTRVSFCSSKTLGLVDRLWSPAHSSWLKAKGICLLCTISRVASTRLCVLGRLEWHLWRSYPSYNLLSTSFGPYLTGPCVMGNILPILDIGKLRYGGFTVCPSLHSKQVTETRFKSRSPPLKACALSTLP